MKTVALTAFLVISLFHAYGNTNLEEQAKAIFKSWFIDFEPFLTGEFVKSELGMIPKGWNVSNFTDIIQISGGGTPKTTNKEYWNGYIPFFTPKDVESSIYTISTDKTITEAGLNNCSSPLYPVDTVFVTARGTVGKIALAGRDMAMNQSCYALLGRESLPSIFVYHLTETVVDRLKNKASGAVFDAIVTRDFDSEKIVLPSSDMVKKFTDIVLPMYSMILQNTLEVESLKQNRDSLLPKLMSGEIDVSKVDV